MTQVGCAMREGLHLRRYRPEDLEAIFRVDEVCFAEAFRFDRRSMRRFAEAHRAISVVATGMGAEIVGFVIVHVERTVVGRHGYVVTLDVLPEARRIGVARRLMDEAERLASESGAGWMELDVFTGNAGAIRFYEQRGYVRVGVRRGFYSKVGHGPALDAFVYRRELGFS